MRRFSRAGRVCLRFLNIIDKVTPPDLDLRLILNNYAAHKTPQIHQWPVKHPRFHPHFTRRTPRGSASRRTLIRNRSSGPKSPTQILDTIAAFCGRINDSGR
jgi:hypothetical protein